MTAITYIVIPARENDPISTVTLRPRPEATIRFSTLTDLLGGHLDVEHLNCAGDRAALWVNAHGFAVSMPINHRASLLLWHHRTTGAPAVAVMGPAILIGAHDGDHVDSVPESMVNLLFEATRYQVEVQLHPDGRWTRVNRHFDYWVDAYTYTTRHLATFQRQGRARVTPA